MLSDIVLSGSFLRVENGFAIIGLESIDVFTSKEDLYEIPVKYWTREDNNPLYLLKPGTRVVMRGRLESDKERGVYILCEILEYLTTKNK